MEFQVFVKPVGASCNLSCTYCYYLDKTKLHRNNMPGILPDDLLEKYIIQHLEASDGEVVFFSWHGGEPLLAGIDFYKKVIAFQQNNNRKGHRIVNGIQTNGTMLDKSWCMFLKSNDFYVGVSIDGPGLLHNQFRQTTNGKHSLDKVISGYKLLLEYGISNEILCVIHRENVKFPLEIYDFFKQLGATYISFLPLVQKSTFSPNSVSSNSVPAVLFGNFLIQIFDVWFELDIGKIKVQFFEEALRAAFKQDHTLCIFKKTCGAVPVLERNGNLYSCDHFVNTDNLLGNINQIPLTDLLNCTQQKQFGLKKFSTLPAYCLKCEFLTMCYGECPKNRFIQTPDGEDGLNYLCPGYKNFFMYCTPFIEAVSSLWNKTGYEER